MNLTAFISPLIFKLAARNVFRNRLRSSIAILSIAIGIAGIAFSEGFISDSLLQLRESNIRSGIGHFQIFKPDYEKYVFRAPEKYLFTEDAALVEKLRTQGALTLTPRLKFGAMLTAHNRDYAIFAEAGIPSREKELTRYFTMLNGEMLKDDDKFKIIVGEGVAKSQKIKAGDMISLYARTYSGSVNILDFEVAGVFRSISQLYDERAIILRLEDAQVFMDTQQIHSYIGLLEKTELTDSFVQALRPAVEALNLKLTPWPNIADFYMKAAELFYIQLFMLEIVIFFMIFLVLNQSLTTAFYERIREFAVMKALGDRRSRITGVLLVEVVILNLCGAIFGGLLTHFIFQAININGITMPPPPNMVIGWTVHLNLSLSLYARALLITVFSTFIAAAVPIVKITRMSVIAGLVEDI